MATIIVIVTLGHLGIPDPRVLCTLSLAHFLGLIPVCCVCKLFVGKSWPVCAESMSCLVSLDYDE